jgi:hypothetical protein
LESFTSEALIKSKSKIKNQKKLKKLKASKIKNKNVIINNK